MGSCRPNSLDKPPRTIGIRVEKVLPLPGDHGSLIESGTIPVAYHGS